MGSFIRVCYAGKVLFGLTGGELFLVVFITAAVLSFRWVVRLGGLLGSRLDQKRDAASPTPSGDGPTE